MRQLKEDQRGYHVLEDINARPAMTYLAKVLRPGRPDHGRVLAQEPVITQTHADVTRDVVATLETPASRGYVLIAARARSGCSWSAA